MSHLEAKAKRKVNIIVFQFSVVMKGIEKKLLEAGYEVASVPVGYSYLEEELERTKDSVFLIYLSDELEKMPDLAGLIDLIDAAKHKLIFIGEKDKHEEFEREVQRIHGHDWLNRPVEMEKLIPLIDSDDMPIGGGSEKKRILIVDDDPSYAKMVREWIKDWYRVDIVTAGMQAISFLLKNKVDLILLDYEMPVVDGPQVLQMLRQDPETKHIPIVFLTGVGTREGVARVLELKPDGYMLKSSTRQEIMSFLNKKLG